ncbi:MAG: EAL domain-containing protein [Massilia sp.]
MAFCAAGPSRPYRSSRQCVSRDDAIRQQASPVTQSWRANHVDRLTTLPNQIKSLDVELAVDDFGTGYSSLSYLKQVPVDGLKIDQSFVRDIPASPIDCAIVRAILAMASNLSLQVIAEGVESEEQLAFLHDDGCQEIQRFLLSPPVNPDNFLARFRNAGRALHSVH